MKLITPKITAALLAVSAIIGYAVVSPAQPPRARGAVDGSKGTPPTEAIVAYLSLTPTQLDAMAAIRTTMQNAAEPIFTQIQTKRNALRDARQANNTTLVASLLADIAALEAQVEKLRSDAQVQIAGSLTADQRPKLATLTAAAALADEVRQAAGLGLLTPPEGAGPGIGAGFGKGKGKGKRGDF